MKNKARFKSVWDALEDDPIRSENLKLRSALLQAICEHLAQKDATQVEISELINITQPRVSALQRGKINEFRLDALVDIAHRLGLHVSLEIAA